MDKRRVPRQRTLKTGKIAFNGGKSVIDCTVRNRSPLGASLQVAAPVGIPDRFELWMDGEHLPCTVVWRKPTQIGVAFESRQPPSA
ncbi:MAG: PilZ domain-containing protein [Alsobacter sp.]